MRRTGSALFFGAFRSKAQEMAIAGVQQPAMVVYGDRCVQQNLRKGKPKQLVFLCEDGTKPIKRYRGELRTEGNISGREKPSVVPPAKYPLAGGLGANSTVPNSNWIKILGFVQGIRKSV